MTIAPTAVTEVDRPTAIDFAYLEAGAGPLALCLHGFPDTAWGWRHLLPALADAGFHAVAPFLRGYAPTVAGPPTATTRSARWSTTPTPCTRCWAATATR